jgi:hypothetical protein
MDTFSIIVGTGILFYALTCAAIIDIATKDFSSLPVKAAWGFTSLIPFIGVVIYFVFGFRKGTRKNKMAPGAESGVDNEGEIG